MLDLLVTTKGETFERIADPLADRGIAVHHCDPTGEPVALDDLPWEPGDADVGYVYPSRFAEGDVLAAAADVPWVNGREAVSTSRNKAGVLARLDAAGVPTPRTVMVSNPADDDAVREAAERVGFPAVVKPNSATRGTGVVRVDDPDSLGGVVDYLDLVHGFRATGDKSYLLQEFVGGARDYRVMVLDGDYAGAVERVGDGWKRNVHQGATARGVDLPESLRTLAERAADAVDVPLLGVDLLVTADRAVVVETNARPTVDDAEKYADGFFDRLADLIARA